MARNMPYLPRLLRPNPPHVGGNPSRPTKHTVAQDTYLPLGVFRGRRAYSMLELRHAVRPIVRPEY